MTTGENKVGSFKAFALGFVMLAGVDMWGGSVLAVEPTKPIRIVVPFAPGGSIDTIPRLIGERLSPLLGVPVIVENRPGAGGNIGAELVYRAPPDGSTFLATPMPLLAVNPHLYSSLRFEPLKFEPVTVVTRYPIVLLARQSLGVSDIGELLDFARKNPGKLSYASQGDGAVGHVVFEKFQHDAKIQAVHVPYKGNGPALSDLMAGHVDLMFSDLIAGMPAIQSGRVKMLAVAGETRLTAYPNVQTIAETLPGFVTTSWIGIVAPPKTPEAITERVATALKAVLGDPAITSYLEKLYAAPAGEGRQAMRVELDSASRVWADVVRRANIRLE